MLPQYRGVVVWDFEYGPDEDHRPAPLCATFLELLTGQRVELWEEFGPRPPFPIDPDWLWVSYHASAETGCHSGARVVDTGDRPGPGGGVPLPHHQLRVGER